jgi:cobalt-zinc-cadmium efflux system protein
VPAVRDATGEHRALRVGMAATSALCLAEALGGWLTNSLALLSDAAHMLSDVGALGLTLFALSIAGRPATAAKTFGYHRAEILAALMNGVVLWVVVFFVLREALGRFAAPPDVSGAGMIIVAAVGLVVNVIVARRLHVHRAHSLNLRGAYLHVLSDLLGSIGVVVAGLVVVTTGWTLVDPIVSVGISLLILAGSWQLVREAVDVLMEAVPPHVDVERLRASLETVPGTREVHDLHVWTITTGHYALSAHAVAERGVPTDQIVARMASRCAEEFHIDHVTIQVEYDSRRASEPAH